MYSRNLLDRECVHQMVSAFQYDLNVLLEPSLDIAVKKQNCRQFLTLFSVVILGVACNGWLIMVTISSTNRHNKRTSRQARCEESERNPGTLCAFQVSTRLSAINL